MSLQVLLWVIAAVLCGVAAFWSPPIRPQLGWLGMCVFILGFIVGGVTLD